ncbi:hypothetical protein NA56DRAFT_482841 [Hyaloscypha hepaticicola]|uniref:Uncharacterized protein n=1 Tax=Hyaloscypha hepaticicola TaxID=2082293 RepID=A0A2J6PEK9_9HELO|nr:hypothetical protein NA56DRAFT_482841 [Hyaloscypha hepaticicola]
MITSFLGRQCAIPWKRVKVLPFQSILNKCSSLAEVVFYHQCRLWLLHDQFMDKIYSFEFPTLTFARRTNSSWTPAKE